MKLDLTEMLYAMSYALDTIENEVGGITTNHGKNVAYLCFLMGKEAGFSDAELRDFVGISILHDNAFSEYIREEYGDVARSGKIKLSKEDGSLDKYLLGYDHSLMGEKNIKLVPFRTNVKNVLLYHHENANGSGAFHKDYKHTNLKSQIIHLADIIDVRWDIMHVDEASFEKIKEKVVSSKNIAFSEKSVDLFLKGVTFKNILDIQKYTSINCLKRDLRTVEEDYTDKEIKNLAKFFAQIVDYKSAFTKRHSIGVAEKCEKMAKFYKFPKEKATRFYLAGALHDIGKLCVVNDILEKPNKLTPEEFDDIKEHVVETNKILCQVDGLEDICDWASHHHERLDGSGYPEGLTEDELTFEDKLLAEIDIYQALSEKRPYKDNIAHTECISIMRGMAAEGKIDKQILEDINKVMK